MKAILTGVAFILLFSVFNVFQIEQDRFIRAQEHVKVLCDDVSAAGVLFFEEDDFSKGQKIFDQVQSEAVIKTLIQNNMKLSSDLSPRTDSFWKEPVTYWTYYFDESGYVTIRKNGVVTQKSSFTFGTLFTEPATKYIKLIKEPTVIAAIEVAYPVEMFNQVQWPKVVRSSAYEDLDRN